VAATRGTLIGSASLIAAGSAGLLLLRSLGPLQWPSVLVYSGLVTAVGGAAVLAWRRGRHAPAAIAVCAGAASIGAGLLWPLSRIHSAGDARIDAFLPAYDFHEFHEIAIHAPPDRVMSALRQVTLADIAVVRTLGKIRNTAMGRPGAPTFPATPRPVVETLMNGGGAFFPLESTEREILFGLAGQPWNDAAPHPRIQPDAFRSWTAPGQVKVATSLKVEDLGAGRSRLTTETRVLATDEAARRTMARYWAFIYPGSGLLRVSLLRAVRTRAEQRQ
jgi:hypothetical protein